MLKIKGCEAISVRHVLSQKNFKKFFLVPFLATKEALAPLASDLIMLARLICSFRHLEHQNPSISSDFIGRNSWLLQICYVGVVGVVVVVRNIFLWA